MDNEYLKFLIKRQDEDLRRMERQGKYLIAFIFCVAIGILILAIYFA